MTSTFTTYAVYRGKDVQCAGSLEKCWEWLLNTYGEHIATAENGTHAGTNRHILATDLAEAGLHIAPVGDGYAKAA